MEKKEMKTQTKNIKKQKMSKWKLQQGSLKTVKIKTKAIFNEKCQNEN